MIKLTDYNTGTSVYLNPRYIVTMYSIEKNGPGTCIIMAWDDDLSVSVRDTPNAIMEMINGKP